MTVSGTTFVYEALPGRVVFGTGAARGALAAEIEGLGARRALLISTETEAALADELAAPLGDRVVDRFTGVRPHVPVPVAEAARRQASECGADVLLSVGGGSTTGTAKAVALTSGLPIVAVPTTYAGSEVTPVWGLTENGEKVNGTDRVVLPRVVIYDPELTYSLPVGLSTVSGLNAMAHCVEAFWAPGRSPIASLMAAEGIGALVRGLRMLAGAASDGAPLAVARSELLYGAYLSGTAFATTGSGLHHKICHALGGLFNLPHAETHAVVLPYVLAFNEPALAAPVVESLARAFESASPLAGLLGFERGLEVPRSLAALGMPEAGIEQAAAVVVTRVPADNPRSVEPKDLVALLRRAWEGVDPAV